MILRELTCTRNSSKLNKVRSHELLTAKIPIIYFVWETELKKTKNWLVKILKSFYVYVLKCHNDKYYVGKTIDINTRYKDHKSGHGSKWTIGFIAIEPIMVWQLCGLPSFENSSRFLWFHFFYLFSISS